MQGLPLYAFLGFLLLILVTGCILAGRLLRILELKHEYQLGPVGPIAPVGPVLVGKKEPEPEDDLAAQNDALRQSMSDLERSYDITLEALGLGLDFKDAEPGGHSKRVTAYSIALARALGLPQSEIRFIARGAFLHDIGKMCIPDKILRKPGVFTAFETEIMKMHCLQGYQILWRIPFLKKEAADIVYSHHERFDGTGYPRRLKGKAIPIGARIFAIADALESITTEHTYRPASTISAACEGIKLGSGTQFDPDIVKVFLRVPTSVWKDLRAEIDKQTPPDFPAA